MIPIPSGARVTATISARSGASRMQRASQLTPAAWRSEWIVFPSMFHTHGTDLAKSPGSVYQVKLSVSTHDRSDARLLFDTNPGGHIAMNVHEAPLTQVGP